MKKLRVGLVGLGLVAQVVHLPVLSAMADYFEVVSGCDLSLSHSQAVAERHAIPRVYSSMSEMLAAEQLDLVAVLNSDEYHTEAVVAALSAGCHVLLEKPICLNPEDVAAMIAARDAANRQVMVGYMRRHAAPYRQLKAALRQGPEIRHVAMRDITGPHPVFTDLKSTVLTAEVSEDLSRERAERGASQIRAAIGDVPESSVNAYRHLNKLCSHDFSALRGLVGKPERVIGASCKRGGTYVSTLLDYGSFTASYDTGNNLVGGFDAYIEIFAGDRRWRLEYDMPYVRHLPTRLITYASGDQGFSITETGSDFEPYKNQWLSLWRALVDGEEIEASLEDASEDVRLAMEIVGAFSLGAAVANT